MTEAERAENEPERAENEDAIPYRYNPLPGRTIRLLQFPDEAVDQPWSLEAHGLENCPTYISLSYTWGPPLATDECKALYEGAQRSLLLQTGNHTGHLRTGLNLWEGLEQLLAAGYTGYLWVDAICINQNDLQERSSQVALMGRIYADCRKVVVWLGRDQSNLADFSWFHDVLLPALDEQFIEGGGKSDFHSIVKSANLGIEPTARWRGYVLFYEERRWFHRCWIIQEVAVAKEVCVFCGPESLDFEEICDMAMFLHDVATDVIPGDWQQEIPHTELLSGHKAFVIATQHALCKLPELPNMNYMALITGSKTQLELCFGLFLSALSAVRGYQASDPRDKAYAALGMATKFLPPGGHVIIVPDYFLSIVEVYKKATIFLIEHLPYLAVLSYVGDRSIRVLSDLPSWVPDFSSTYVGSAYPTRYEVYPHNACTSGLAVTYPRSVAGSTLQLYGGYFDTVTMVVSGIDNLRTRGDRPIVVHELLTLKLCHCLLDFCSSLDRRYVNGQQRLEALSRTLILNQIDRRPVSGEASVIFRGWLLITLAVSAILLSHYDELRAPFRDCCKLLNDLDEVRNGTLPGEDSVLLYAQLTFTNDVTIIERRPQDADPEDIPPEEDQRNSSDAVNANHRSYNRALNRGLFLRQRLYKTSSGCIGLGPPSMRPGDQVYFICDATVPFILRSEKATTHYTFIGETYLYGFMNGEVFTNDFRERIQPVYLV